MRMPDLRTSPSRPLRGRCWLRVRLQGPPPGCARPPGRRLRFRGPAGPRPSSGSASTQAAHATFPDRPPSARCAPPLFPLLQQSLERWVPLRTDEVALAK